MTMSLERPYPLTNYEPYRPSRNPYAEKFQVLPARAPTGFTCEATEAKRGQWRKFFGAEPGQRLNLEIGIYHGETIVEMGERYPHEFFLGIEWSFREAYKATEKAMRRELHNVVILRANAARLPWIFAPGEIDRVWISFPDPWPKLAQQKWRMLHADFFRSLALLLDPGKELLLKTDDSDYAAFINRELTEAGAFDPLEDSLGSALWDLQPLTPFERIFLRNSSPFFRWALARNPKAVPIPAPVQAIFH